MGAIRYYPSFRIRTGLYTNGGTFYLNGKNYVGPYYITYNGEVYTGATPLSGLNEPLSRTPPSTNSSRIAQRPEASQLRGDQSTVLRQLTPYLPIVTEEDYQKGYFKRYFVKRIIDKGYIIEVEYNDWTKVANRDVEYKDYEAIEMMWQLRGPLKDTRISQYETRGGVYDTNKRTTEKKAKTFIGLVEYMGGDYTKFARIDNNVG